MTMWNYLFQNRKDKRIAAMLFLCFSFFYTLMNVPYLTYIRENSDVLAEHNPFYGAKFPLNLFNFDPSFYYGFTNMTVIHPYVNFLSGSLEWISRHVGGNTFFLILQSGINALTVVILYGYLRRKADNEGGGAGLPVLFAVFFGVSSYALFSSLIPDSYVYAQFGIVCSLCYLAYNGWSGKRKTLPAAAIGFLQFAITSTNVATYMGALLIRLYEGKKSDTIRKWLKVAVVMLVMAILLAVVQLLLFDGKSWFNNWQQGLENGGFSYAAPFSFAQHWKAIYMLFISPVLTPDITLISAGIVAFATDLSIPYPFYVSIVGFGLLGMAVAGWIRTIRTKEAWTLAIYIGAAIGLHLVIGFGLAVFEYDLYLYAGHYLFANFLLAASFVMSLKRGLFRTICVAAIIIFMCATLANNIVKHSTTIAIIRDAYIQIDAGEQ